MAETEVRMGVVGTGMWANAGHMTAYRDNPRATIVGVCDTLIERAQQAAKEFNARVVTDDYTELVARDDIDAVDIVTPNALHAPVALAAIEAGKHVLCEKPLAMSHGEALRMVAAAESAAVKTGVNFVYRNHPAARFSRHLIEEGHIGRIFHVTAIYMQGWLVNPRFPLAWRLQRELTGTGVLGDLGAHIIDLVEWLTDERIASLVSDMQTFVTERPLVDGGGTGQVDVDDGASFLARFGNGAMGMFVCSRYGTARANHQRIEIYGDKGAVAFVWEDRDHVQAALGPAFIRESQMVEVPVPRRFKSTLHGVVDPFGSTQNLHRFIDAILDDHEMTPNFRDGVRNQEVLEAVTISERDRSWVSLPLEGAQQA